MGRVDGAYWGAVRRRGGNTNKKIHLKRKIIRKIKYRYKFRRKNIIIRFR
jgi:hypothetical protein